MNTIWTIAKREFKAYFVSPIAYVYLITFLVVVHWLFLKNFFFMGQANLRAFFTLMPWIYLFFIPAVAMGKWAEERKLGTIELLFTMPILKRDVVLGKFLAGFKLIAAALFLTLPLPITVALLGNADLGPNIGGYLGLLFLGGAYLSISLWISSLTDNQIIAFILGVVACFALFIIGEPLVTTGLPPLLVSFFQYLGLGTHFESMGRGVVDTRDLIYYLSVIVCFLFLNLKPLKRRIAVLTLLIALATFNLISSSHFARLDLTEQKNFTLSKSTKAILKNLEDIVTLRLYFSKELPPELIALKRDIEDILTEFKTHAASHIQIEYHDPQENPVEEQKVQIMGIPPVEVNVIKKDKQELAKVYLGLAIRYEAKQEVIPVIQSTGNLEYQLAEGIWKATQKKKQALGWIGPKEKSNPDEPLPKESFSLVQDYLEKRFAISYITTEWDKLDPKEIPLLLFVVPENLSEAQAQAFQTYLEQGGQAICLVDRFSVNLGQGLRPTHKKNPLEALLKSFGVQVNPDLILDQSSAMATFTGGLLTFHMPYPYWVQIRPEGFDAKEPFVSMLNSLVLPWTSSIRIEEGLPPDTTVTKLFQTTPYAVKNENVDPIRSLDPQATREALSQGVPGTYPLSVLVTKKNPQGKNEKLIVVGTSRIIQDNFIDKFEENIVFLENAIDALSTGDLLIGIRSKGVFFKPIAILSDTKRQMIKVVDILISPLLLMGLCLFIFLKRRMRVKTLRLDYGPGTRD